MAKGRSKTGQAFCFPRKTDKGKHCPFRKTIRFWGGKLKTRPHRRSGRRAGKGVHLFHPRQFTFLKNKAAPTAFPRMFVPVIWQKTTTEITYGKSKDPRRTESRRI